ncbi:hypothetical protein [Dysgonomonas sp. 216]|uniref:hypothetical protein n=1 Tax=Dysgonomonas sp. 216 TaxID=2302934 RepID=UPI0013CF94F3|nr:hypothetical protein [Dysgonomonas sp. 216]
MGKYTNRGDMHIIKGIIDAITSFQRLIISQSIRNKKLATIKNGKTMPKYAGMVLVSGDIYHAEADKISKQAAIKFATITGIRRYFIILLFMLFSACIK